MIIIYYIFVWVLIVGVSNYYYFLSIKVQIPAASGLGLIFVRIVFSGGILQRPYLILDFWFVIVQFLFVLESYCRILFTNLPCNRHMSKNQTSWNIFAHRKEKTRRQFHRMTYKLLEDSKPLFHCNVKPPLSLWLLRNCHQRCKKEIK